MEKLHRRRLQKIHRRRLQKLHRRRLQNYTGPSTALCYRLLAVTVLLVGTGETPIVGAPGAPGIVCTSYLVRHQLLSLQEEDEEEDEEEAEIFVGTSYFHCSVRRHVARNCAGRGRGG